VSVIFLRAVERGHWSAAILAACGRERPRSQARSTTWRKNLTHTPWQINAVFSHAPT